MAWITPVTDRASDLSRTYASDMNRIAGNIAVLGGNPVKTNYTDTDMVHQNEWDYIVGFARLYDTSITDSTRFDNLNAIEEVMRAAHTGSLYPANDLYCNVDVYPKGE